MQILVVSNRADFFREVFQMCRTLLGRQSVCHLSHDAWEAADLSTVPAGSWVVRDGETLTEDNPFPRLYGKPFALGRWVCHNIAERASQWELLSRTDLTLRVQELAIMTSAAPAIREDILVESPHLRVAELRCPTRVCLISGLRNRLLKGISEFQLGGPTEENHFCMALEEALANAFYHGNLELSSELKEDGSSRFADMAAEREQTMPFKRRMIRVTEMASPFGLWIRISDEGLGFNVEAAIRRSEDPELFLSSGRGLMMMRGFTDELFFNSSGNEVTLVLYRRGQDRELPVRVSRSSDHTCDSGAVLLLNE